MDPISIIGVTAAIEQILQTVYAYGASVREAKSEINQLSSELLALRAALDHVYLNSDVGRLGASMEDLGLAKEAQEALSTSTLSTPEFAHMLLVTDNIIKDLLGRLQQKPGKSNAAKRRLTWHMVKDDIKRDIERLNRLKSFFILATTSDNLVLCQESYLKICDIDLRLQKQEDYQERKHNLRLRENVRQWLAPYDANRLYEDAVQNFQEGTGEWFLDDVFRRWLEDDSPPLLWLRARPGSGKTTLLSAAVRYAQDRNQSRPSSSTLAFFYCSFTDQNSQDVQNMLGSFLVQMCDSNPVCWKELENQYLKRKGKLPHEPKTMDLETMKLLVRQMSMHFQETLLFLDALNESRQHQKIFATLLNLISDGLKIRIVLSSTEEILPTISPQQGMLVSMEANHIAKDIAKVVDLRLEADERLCDLPSNLKRDIKRTLERGSDGIFRWAHCQLETLADNNTAQEIKEALDDVPYTLELTYRALLKRIPQHQCAVARRTLFWVAFALKPMTLKELSEAIIINEHSSIIHEDMRLLRDEILVKSCSSLISYDFNTTCISLAHSSVFTYLTSPDIRRSDVSSFYLDAPTAYNSIARRCINYMMLPAFKAGACAESKLLQRRYSQWPLLGYVSETLFAHLYYIDLDPEMRTLLLRFFATHDQPNGGNFGAWVQACFPSTLHNIEHSTPLYYAARYGLLRIVQIILATEGTRNLETSGGVYRSTPLHVAAWQGRTEVVAELLKAGASAKEMNDEGRPGLIWAVMFGYTDIERMLREAGAELNDDAVAQLVKERRRFTLSPPAPHADGEAPLDTFKELDKRSPGRWD